ncbi:hypothetical protein [Dyadobacter sp. CY312]|uniref:hypothetical protein n=1 Tax=Dyadobacter sp. CY312 TaxID=2907303 RepID=UPI001F2C36CC|nr:hypothetical protein [Dyadobacter sp. CY312]MCE7041790.1 hypothetical protein [Dyadobacter sp. CY312]
MKDHKGMRPQDIVVLLAIVAIQKKNWAGTGVKFIYPIQNKNLAELLNISSAEISASINRSFYAGLIEDSPFKQVFMQSFLEFLIYGLKYAFPVKPGILVRGIPTAHSAEPLQAKLSFQEEIIWEYAEGNVRGQAIVPLYHTVPEIVGKDKLLYELLALTDSLRIGGARERELAIEELKNRFFQ